MPKLLAIDPGNEYSGYVIVDTETYKPLQFGKVKNGEMLAIIDGSDYQFLAIEMVQNYGARLIGGRVVGGAGQTIFSTCVFIGRFAERADIRRNVQADLIYRTTIKAHITGVANSKDAQVRMCLLDRYGQKGTKANPGVLYGFKSDCFSALAVATYWLDQWHGKT